MKEKPYTIICGDALEEMAKLPDKSIDAVICDLPYGTTACAWDVIIPFEPMWKELKRLVKPKSAIVLFGSQPFTSALIMSNLEMFKYEWIWEKVRVTGHLNAKKQPMKSHEVIAVFYKQQSFYSPQMTPSNGHFRGPFGKRIQATTVYGSFSDENRTHAATEYYPRSLVKFQAEMQPIHPTQKPVELLRYLVRTYTKEGETVLDFTAGSFSTGVACAIENRNFIGIEKDAHYCAIGEARIKRANLEPCDIPRIIKSETPMPLFENLES